MPTTRNITIYQFDELDEKAQEKAIEICSDYNVDHDWWEHTCDQDAATIGLKITGFDLYRGTIEGDLSEYLLDSCKLIRINHGKDTETFATARQYLKEYIEAYKVWRKEQDEEEYSDDMKPADWLYEFRYSDEADVVTNNYKKALLEDYLIILQKEYDFLTSREEIINTIRDNEYEFLANGTRNPTTSQTIL
jgi:hypothetical protein